MDHFDILESELKLFAEWESLLKRRSLIYQHDAKVTVATHYGMRFAEVDLPFCEWLALRDRYERETGKSL